MKDVQFGVLNHFLSILPSIGILAFVGLYIYSSTLYPGGSQVDLTSQGFDWVNNYWCNLMNEKGMNGLTNPARPFAILAMALLCGSLTLFFIQFAKAFASNIISQRIISICGILSMGFAVFMFTSYHDLMTIISSIFGLAVVIVVIIEIYRSDLRLYKYTGMLCIMLLALNNYIYYSEQFIHFLPILQKLSFAVVLAWIIGLNLEIVKLNKSA